MAWVNFPGVSELDSTAPFVDELLVALNERIDVLPGISAGANTAKNALNAAPVLGRPSGGTIGGFGNWGRNFDIVIDDLMSRYTDKDDNGGDWNGVLFAQVAPPWTEANLLAATGEASRIRAPSLAEPGMNEMPFEWARQQFKFLDKFRWSRVPYTISVLNREEKTANGFTFAAMTTAYDATAFTSSAALRTVREAATVEPNPNPTGEIFFGDGNRSDIKVEGIPTLFSKTKDMYIRFTNPGAFRGAAILQYENNDFGADSDGDGGRVLSTSVPDTLSTHTVPQVGSTTMNLTAPVLTAFGRTTRGYLNAILQPFPEFDTRNVLKWDVVGGFDKVTP